MTTQGIDEQKADRRGGQRRHTLTSTTAASISTVADSCDGHGYLLADPPAAIVRLGRAGVNGRLARFPPPQLV